eukprot:CAMPEP_0178447836 /NCGR_PEP_ID=MMETSP0689_2-20121128/41642_1 /TAXON_ID=160604 /ORGANISM="Amphidinium massartii, Strain CS-259" /LENGTH=1568 /DNA_ID=CAMNT_0020072939 /DNA_START=10 /DNA_END=4713 /DNA_ORIENTATION=-
MTLVGKSGAQCMRIDASIRLILWFGTLLLTLVFARGQGDCDPPLTEPPIIRIAGSSTVIPVAEAWRNQMLANYTYQISGGGSSAGARRVCCPCDDPDHVDVGDMSRDWRSSEAVRLDDGITLECLDKDTGELTGRRVTQLQVGKDGLAVVVRKNGAGHNCLTDPAVGGLTTAQLRWIFSDWTNDALAAGPYGNVDISSIIPGDDGDNIKEWSDIHPNCDEVPIHPYGAGDQSGTYEFFAQQVFNADVVESFAFCNVTVVTYLQSLSNEQQAELISERRDDLGSANCYAPSEDDELIRDWILADTGGIAYFGFAYYTSNLGVLTVSRIADDKIKGITDTEQFIVTPDIFSITDGSYSVFTRTLYMNIFNEAWDRVRPYLAFGFSETGQNLVNDVGYVTLNPAVVKRTQLRIRDGENIAADYVPVIPDVCWNGSELMVSEYINIHGTPKENYTCLPCKVGYHKPLNTPSSCDPCLEGSVSAEAGRSICDSCERGEYAAFTGLTVCSSCALGSYIAVRGATACEICSPGTAQALIGETACRACAPGWFQPSPGMTSCLECQPGTFATEESQTSCNLCEEGYFMDEAASNSSCSRCPRGEYSDTRGSSTCTACGDQLTTQYTGAYHVTHCVCRSGSYMPVDSNATRPYPCLPCPEGMDCPAGSAYQYLPTYRQADFVCPADIECNFPEVWEGHMTLALEPLKVYRCAAVEQCPGVNPATCRDLRNPFEVACGRCDDNAYKQGDLCKACGDGPNVILLLLAAFVFVAVLFAASLAVNKDMIKQSHSTITVAVITGLTLTGMQSLGVFSSLSLQWFEPMKTIVESLSVFGFDLSILRLSCQIGSSPLWNYIARQLVAPMAVPFVFVSLLIKKSFFNPNVCIWVELINTVGAVYSVFFISVVISATAPLICFDHPGENGASVVSQPSVLCFEHGVWYGLMTAGMLSLLFVTLPFMATCAYGIWQYPAMVVSQKPHLLNSFRFLFMRFRAELYYYGSILLARNFCIPCIPAVVRGDIALQVILMCSAVLFFLVVQMSLQPWRTFTVNLFDANLSAMLVLVLVCGTASSNITAKEESIMWLGTIIFAVVIVAILATFFKVAIDRFRPANLFDGFICHHKAGAAAQVRYLKICLVAKGKHRIFIDTDDLQNLDGLFDTVRTRIRRLIVYLSKGTLARPWCCGEVVTAYVNRVPTVVVYARDFVMYERRSKDDWSELLDFRNSCLLQYGISIENVVQAYKWLLEGSLTMIHLRTSIHGRAKIQAAACDLLTTSLAVPQRSSIDGSTKDALVISSDPNDDEASATAGILLAKITERTSQLNLGSLYCLCDVEVTDDDANQLAQLIQFARANIVLLTPQSMQSLLQLRIIIEAVGYGAFNIIPVSTPLYSFPTETYYAHVLPPLAAQATNKDLDIAITAVRTFFKTIAVFFGTHSVEKVLEAQALEIFNRIPKVRVDKQSGKFSCNPLDAVGQASGLLKSSVTSSYQNDESVFSLQTGGSNGHIKMDLEQGLQQETAAPGCSSSHDPDLDSIGQGERWRSPLPKPHAASEDQPSFSDAADESHVRSEPDGVNEKRCNDWYW